MGKQPQQWSFLTCLVSRSCLEFVLVQSRPTHTKKLFTSLRHIKGTFYWTGTDSMVQSCWNSLLVLHCITEDEDEVKCIGGMVLTAQSKFLYSVLAKVDETNNLWSLSRKLRNFLTLTRISQNRIVILGVKALWPVKCVL